MAENKVTYGLSNMHIAFLNDGKYETPQHIPGAVQFTPSTVGDNSKFAADNNPSYHEINTNAGYTAEVTQAQWPLEVLAEMLGYEIDENGAMIEVTGTEAKPFALMFQVEGDKSDLRVVNYFCKASRPAQEHSTTTDTTDISGQQLSITIAPYDLNKDGELHVKATLPENETNAAVYKDFFKSVYGVKVEG